MYKWEEKCNPKDTLWLLSTDEFKALPYGTTLMSINNTFKVKGKDIIDVDIRFGSLAYGLTAVMAEEQNLGPLFTTWLLKKQ